MPTVKKSKNGSGGIKWITHDQAMALLDARAKRVLNISGAEFVSRWKAGEYKNVDSADCPGVIELALLAPVAETKNGRKESKRGVR